MPGFLAFELSGDKQLERELLRTGQRAIHAAPAFDSIGHRILKMNREQFESEGARGSGGWRALQPTTVEEKRRHGAPQPERILFDTGGGFEALSLYGAENQLFDVRDDSFHFAVIGDEPIKYHQPDPQGRRAMEFTEEDRVEIVRDLQHWVFTGSVRF
jgi:hypothetical protein